MIHAYDTCGGQPLNEGITQRTVYMIVHCPVAFTKYHWEWGGGVRGDRGGTKEGRGNRGGQGGPEGTRGTRGDHGERSEYDGMDAPALAKGKKVGSGGGGGSEGTGGRRGRGVREEGDMIGWWGSRVGEWGREVGSDTNLKQDVAKLSPNGNKLGKERSDNGQRGIIIAKV